MKRIIIISLITILVSIPLFWVWKYIHAKTIWKDSTDCMVNYIKNYYPIWSTYLVFDKYPHIDKRWIWNEYMKETKQITWCYINDWFISSIFNSSYCLITLWIETFFLPLIN